LAIRYKHYDLAKRLIERGADVNQLLYSDSSLLPFDPDDNDNSLAKLLIMHATNINYQNNNGDTLLHIFFYSEMLSELLLDQGINTALCNNKGYPAIWVLNLSPLENLIKKGKITFEHLRQKVQKGPDAGKSFFWEKVARHRYKGIQFYNQNIDWLWNKFNQDITLQDISFKPVNGPSIFWMLSTTEYLHYFNFNLLWQKFKNEITMEHLRESYDKKNIFSQLHQIDKDKDFSFIDVWQLFKKEISIDDFCPQTYPYFLQSTKIKVIVSEILSQVPGKLYAYRPLGLIDGIRNVNTHLECRNDFFEELELAQKEADFQKINLLPLFSLAEKAQNEGYLNAYYDLGAWLEILNHEEAMNAFAKVPQKSWHFEKVQLALAQHYFTKAKQATDADQKIDFIQKSLSCILHVEEKALRVPHIKALVVFALSDEDPVEEKDLPPYLLALTEQQLSTEAWLTLLEHAKQERYRLRTENNQQNELLAELQALEEVLNSLRQTEANSREAIENDEEVASSNLLVFSLADTDRDELAPARRSPTLDNDCHDAKMAIR
jgi:hypothetical protein